MASRRLVFGLCAVVLAQSSAAQGQYANQPSFRSNVQRASKLGVAPKLVTPTMRTRQSLGTYDTSRYGGITTRSEQLRGLLPSRFSQYALTSNAARPSPVKVMLDRRNLLSVRSPLARQSGAFIGRNDFVKDESGTMLGDYSVIEKKAQTTTAPVDSLRPDNGKLQDAIVARLAAKADEYYETAMSAFRKGQMLRSRDYLNLLRDLEPDSTRSYLGSVFVFAQKDDYMQAGASLLRALDIMKSLDDVKVDTNKFYKSSEDFRRRVERVNIVAQVNQRVAAPRVLLAYYSYLNGDIGTAIDAAASAEKTLTAPADAPVRKFRELLIQKRTSPKAAN